MKKVRKGKVGIIIGLAAALTCSSAVAISQLCFQENGAAIARAETSGVTAQSIIAEEIATAWDTAVEQSITTGEQVTVTLEDNWIAQDDETNTTTFGTGTSFDHGRIYVPATANIVLDLNGYTIDRGLQDNPVAYGSIIYVKGTLELRDSSGTDAGTITGGNESGIIGDADGIGGAGISVDGGTFILHGGTITGNTATTKGGGVYVNSGTFSITGGTITGNTASNGDGGGVFVSDNSTATISGGLIIGNSGANDARSNVYTESKINIGGKLRARTHIGITVSEEKTLTSGYTASGNKIGNEARYFSSDNDDYKITNNGTEVTVVTNTDAVDTVDWSYTSYDASYNILKEVEWESGLTGTAAYTGGSFSFDAISAGIVTAIDENGRTVTSFVNVGTYYLSVVPTYAGQYHDPVFIFTIVPAELDQSRVKISADPVIYTGEELTTSVKVFLDGVMLKENTDYTLSYKDNVNAGEGTVVITAKGNYTGTVEGTFTIKKATLGVRWGITSFTYSGEAHELVVYPEGLKGNDEVNLIVKYYDETETYEVTPIEAGRYIAKVSLDSDVDNYELTMEYETYLYVVANKVDAVWSETKFGYDGAGHGVTAYVVDEDGNEIELDVTYYNADGEELGDGELPVDAGTYTATASLPEEYEGGNYKITESTLSVTVIIAKAKVEAEWADAASYSWNYTGTGNEIEVGLKGVVQDENGQYNDLSNDIEYSYYNAEGTELGEGELPVDAGIYKLVISLKEDSDAYLNYQLTGTTEQIITIIKIGYEVSIDRTELVYSGTAEVPEITVMDENGRAIENYTVTYALVNNSNEVIEQLGENKPVNVGKYVLIVEVDDINIEQVAQEKYYEITVKTVTVDWDYGDTALVTDDGVYYLYNGTAHKPTATADGIALTVTGSGRSVGEHTVTASMNNSNYVLDGDTTTTFNVIKSKVVSIVWYEYGSTEPVKDGEIPSYEYISVFGQEDGPRLSAYGVLTAADENIEWDCEGETLIALKVSYDRYSESFWSVGTYTATAELSSADKTNSSCSMRLGLKDELQFEVTAITHSASAANIKWVVVVDGKHVDAASYTFTYDGNKHNPIAILITKPNTYDPYNPDEETFVALTVAGGQTEAGTYYAYIVPDTVLGNHEIQEGDAECKFVISPLEIEIDWKNVEDGKITVTYNGEAQSPTADILTDLGTLSCEMTFDSFVNAGTYTARANVGNNYVVKGGGSIEFVIERFKISTNEVVWTADGEEKEANGVKWYEWQYNGEEHTATASLKVILTDGGEEVEISLSVTGSALTYGTHYVYATLASGDIKNANYEMDVAKFRLKIVQDVVTVIWEDADEAGNIVYTYDGKAHTPTAYYLNGEEKVYLNVLGSGTESGEYVAFITDNIDIANSATKEFTIKAKQLKVVWNQEGKEFGYTGEARTPSVTFYETVTNEEGEAEVKVNLVLGKDYTVTGYINAGSYTSELNLLNVNYEVVENGKYDFTITKKVVYLTWYGAEGSIDNFEWAFGEEHVPTVTASVNGLEITVIGAETHVGTYTAVAVLSSSYQSNYVIDNPTHEFSIKGSAISVVWTDENGNEPDELTWEYDGEEHLPKAYIKLANGSKGTELTVVGAGIYAKSYVAKAILPANCSWAEGENGECTFTISKKIVDDVVWSFNGATEKVDEDGNSYYEVVYNGEYLKPTATIASTGEELTVTGATVNKGEYTATAVLANEENYAFAENAKYTIKFVILAKTVNVKWYGANDSEADFEWAYDGQVHSPTAWAVERVEGEWVKLFEIPVLGGTASGGQHVATLLDVFENYDFVEAKCEQPFSIIQNGVKVAWSNEPESGESYTYTYDGKVKLPKATATFGEDIVPLTYLIKNEDGEAISAIINVGTYTVTVTPADKNYTITEGKSVVDVVVEAQEVTVKWSGDTFTENGLPQAPTAWFEITDDDGHTRKVGLTVKVEGEHTEVGEYTATAETNSANYVLEEESSSTPFSIVKDTTTEYKWVWGADGSGWVEIKDETDPGTGEGGSETTDPDEGDNTGDNTGENTGENPGENTGENTGDNNEGGDNENGTTPTEPENPGTGDGSEGGEAIVPGQGGSGTGEEDDDDNGDGENPNTGDGDGNDNPDTGNV